MEGKNASSRKLLRSPYMPSANFFLDPKGNYEISLFMGISSLSSDVLSGALERLERWNVDIFGQREITIFSTRSYRFLFFEFPINSILWIQNFSWFDSTGGSFKRTLFSVAELNVRFSIWKLNKVNTKNKSERLSCISSELNDSQTHNSNSCELVKGGHVSVCMRRLKYRSTRVKGTLANVW